MANNFTDASNRAPARFKDAVARLDGDVSLLQEMAAMTAPEFDGLIEQAKTAVEEGQCDDAVRILHKLKGMLSTFESDGIVMEIQEVIHAARTGKTESMQSHLSQHLGGIDALVRDIRQFAKA